MRSGAEARKVFSSVAFLSADDVITQYSKIHFVHSSRIGYQLLSVACLALIQALSGRVEQWKLVRLIT